MVLETLIKLCVAELDFLEIFFTPKNQGIELKVGFFEFKENLVVNFH